MFDQAGTTFEDLFIPDPEQTLGSGTLTIDGTELGFDVHGCSPSLAINGTGFTSSGIPYTLILDSVGLFMRIGYDPVSRDRVLQFTDAFGVATSTQNVQLDPTGHVEGPVLLVRNDPDATGNSLWLEFLTEVLPVVRRGEDPGEIVDRYIGNGDAFRGDISITCQPT